MADLFVGGFGLKNHFKTFEQAIDASREGDIVHLQKSVQIQSVNIEKNITIDGHGKTLKI